MDSRLMTAKRLGVKYNVSFKVIDQISGNVVSEHVGHNSATNSMLVGVAHYLLGDGLYNQSSMLEDFIPKYISLGTMGLSSQEADAEGLPTGIGESGSTEEELFIDYMDKLPGFGADGYDSHENNGREYFGLGPMFADRPDETKTIKCELISTTFPRSQITFRDVLPESQSTTPKTIDVVLSAMISTGALKQFREPDKDYIFITEAGLWSSKTWDDSGENSLLAGYRIIPTNSDNWDMSVPENRQILKESILRVGKNQVVQVVWKLELGSVDDLVGAGGESDLPDGDYMRWGYDL